MQGWLSSPNASEEDEESDDDEEKEQEALFLFFFGGPDLFFSEKPTLLPPASGRPLLEALAGGALPAGALEAETLRAFAEAKGRLSSSSDSSEEEEDGTAALWFFLEAFTGMEVSGFGAGLLLRLEGCWG